MQQIASSLTRDTCGTGYG